ncbi:MAG: phosphotransferase [Halioglobus sp.]
MELAAAKAMLESLPDATEKKLQLVLGQWHQWRCQPALEKKPDIIRNLSSGLSNYSILVDAGKRFVVRIDGLNPVALGLNRQAEHRVLTTASAAGIAPQPAYYNPDLGVLVYQYVEAIETRDSDIENTASLIRKIHSLPHIHFRLDLRERLTRYEKHIEHRGDKLPQELAAARKRTLQMLSSLHNRAQDLVLCHNDLHSANRITTAQGHLVAIDWEYTGMTSRWFELAVTAVSDELSEAQKSVLVSSYLNRTPDAEEQDLFAKHQHIYRYLELLWFYCLDNKKDRARYITAQKLEHLNSNLNLTPG